MTDKLRLLLDTNHRSSVDYLELTGLLVCLYLSKVTEGMHRRRRNSMFSDFSLHSDFRERYRDALLKSVGRQGLDDYYRTIARLHQSQQSRIAEILGKGGGRTLFVNE